MPHALPTCGRVVASVVLAMVLSILAAPVTTSAESAHADLRVSVVVAPSCSISSGSGGFGLRCSAGAARTSQVTLAQAVPVIALEATPYAATPRVMSPYSGSLHAAWTSPVLGPRRAPRSSMFRPTRIQPIVLTVNF